MHNHIGKHMNNNSTFLGMSKILLQMDSKKYVQAYSQQQCS